jgi:hypothetical protein
MIGTRSYFARASSVHASKHVQSLSNSREVEPWLEAPIEGIASQHSMDINARKILRFEENDTRPMTGCSAAGAL